MPDTLKQDILTLARQVGFDLAGVTAPTIADGSFYARWLENGLAGSMGYLRRTVEKRFDPRRLVPGVRSILCVGLNYFQETRREERDCFAAPAMTQKAVYGRVAMYAWGEDYHRVVKGKLHRLAGEIQKTLGRDFFYRAFVDSGPVLEKPLAAQAGLGWVGKNGLLINRRLGSFFVLGELFLDFELPTDKSESNRCGECRACLEACPAGAIVEPGVVDARRCAAYLTIEHRGEVEADLARGVGENLFGCDRCQRVCPFNQHCPRTGVAEFRRPVLGPELEAAAVLGWDEASWKARTAGSAGSRVSLDQWRRNARMVIENGSRS